MKKTIFTIALAVLGYNATTIAQEAENSTLKVASPVVSTNKYFNHNSNTHLRGKLRLWKEANSSDNFISHGIGTESFHNTYGPGKSYANTIGHKFYTYRNDLVAQFGIGGGGKKSNRLTSRINGIMGINTITMPGAASFNASSHRNTGYGGMSVNISGKGTNLMPFYSYATNNGVRAWHYFDEKDDSWRLYNGGIRMVVARNGNVGIGSLNPDSKLTVKGKVHAEEVLVDLAVPADYVFEKYYNGTSSLKANYTMPTLEEVASFTKKNKHLPEIPSAKNIKENGLQVGEMTNLLLQKIEELTLYTIEQEQRIKKLETLVITKK